MQPEASPTRRAARHAARHRRRGCPPTGLPATPLPRLHDARPDGRDGPGVRRHAVCIPDRHHADLHPPTVRTTPSPRRTSGLAWRRRRLLTCLTGDTDPNSICTASLPPGGDDGGHRPRARASSAPAGGTPHAGGRPDSTGCFPFCSQNSDCGIGRGGHGLQRARAPAARPRSTTRLPDGSPCNPRMTVDGPRLDHAAQRPVPRHLLQHEQMYPPRASAGFVHQHPRGDRLPPTTRRDRPRAPQGTDNLAICIFRSCTSNWTAARRTSPLPRGRDGHARHRRPDDLRLYPSTAQPRGVPGDGGDHRRRDRRPGRRRSRPTPPRPTPRPRDAAPADASADRPADAATGG